MDDDLESYWSDVCFRGNREPSWVADLTAKLWFSGSVITLSLPERERASVLRWVKRGLQLPSTALVLDPPATRLYQKNGIRAQLLELLHRHGYEWLKEHRDDTTRPRGVPVFVWVLANELHGSPDAEDLLRDSCRTSPTRIADFLMQKFFGPEQVTFEPLVYESSILHLLHLAKKAQCFTHSVVAFDNLNQASEVCRKDLQGLLETLRQLGLDSPMSVILGYDL